MSDKKKLKLMERKRKLINAGRSGGNWREVERIKN